jgi:hypothetical protein
MTWLALGVVLAAYLVLLLVASGRKPRSHD